MSHPKSKISKQRKRKRRTHKKAAIPHVLVCDKSGEEHISHHAYSHEGDMYYKGKLLVKFSTED